MHFCFFPNVVSGQKMISIDDFELVRYAGARCKFYFFKIIIELGLSEAKKTIYLDCKDTASFFLRFWITPKNINDHVLWCFCNLNGLLHEY